MTNINGIICNGVFYKYAKHDDVEYYHVNVQGYSGTSRCSVCGIRKYCHNPDLCTLHSCLTNSKLSYLRDDNIIKADISYIKYGWVYNGYIFLVNDEPTTTPCEDGCLLHQICRKYKYPKCTIHILPYIHKHINRLGYECSDRDILVNNVKTLKEFKKRQLHCNIATQVYRIDGSRLIKILLTDFNAHFESLFKNNH